MSRRRRKRREKGPWLGIDRAIARAKRPQHTWVDNYLNKLNTVYADMNGLVRQHEAAKERVQTKAYNEYSIVVAKRRAVGLVLGDGASVLSDADGITGNNAYELLRSYIANLKSSIDEQRAPKCWLSLSIRDRNTEA